MLTLALSARALCEALELPHFIKTSGSSGLHVLVPLGRQLDHAGAISFGQVLAEALVQQHPDIATTERVVRARRSKVYVDYLQNGRGKLLVAPFSARPLPGAPVSMPLRWDEVGPGLHPRKFTALDAPARMERLGTRPVPRRARRCAGPGRRPLAAHRVPRAKGHPHRPGRRTHADRPLGLPSGSVAPEHDQRHPPGPHVHLDLADAAAGHAR